MMRLKDVWLAVRCERCQGIGTEPKRDARGRLVKRRSKCVMIVCQRCGSRGWKPKQVDNLTPEDWILLADGKAFLRLGWTTDVAAKVRERTYTVLSGLEALGVV